jgi:catechol 2,3-dioxygenase-like lactoylglutathione lyase family enzyme
MSFAHLTLATRDVQASCRFFTLAMGWNPVSRPNNINREAAWLSVGPGQELHLLRVDDFEPSPFEKEFGRHLAVEFPADQFPALQERLIEQGAEIIAPQRPTPFERFFFKDPNGYMFEVVDAGRQSET